LTQKFQPDTLAHAAARPDSGALHTPLPETRVMASIDILHDHSKSPAQARKAVEDVARKLSERFDMDYAWVGDTLKFNRSGVDGRIALLPKQLHVTADLGFLLSAMKGPIESEIRRVLDEKFS